jgi:spore coat protein CotF
MTNQDNEQNRSKTMMNLMHEDLARAQMAARLGEAQQLRRGHQQVVARRLSRKAEQAARQARLALARAI